MKNTHVLFLSLFVAFVTSCVTGGIKYTATAVRPDVTTGPGGEMRCGLVPSKHLDAAGDEVEDKIEADVFVRTPFDGGAGTILAVGATYAAMRDADNAGLLSCSEASGISQLYTGLAKERNDGRKALTIVTDLISTTAAEETAAQRGAAPAEQPKAEPQASGQASAQPTTAPAAAPATACSKITGAQSFQDLADGFSQLVAEVSDNDPKKDEKKKEYAKIAAGMQRIASAPNGESLTAHKAAFTTHCQ
jgi:hypothetical protein